VFIFRLRVYADMLQVSMHQFTSYCNKNLGSVFGV